MGLEKSQFTGCLLADAMRLGKTLQIITLIWTLLKQSPTVKRVLIICPSSLVENWGNEMRKWLGNERLTPLIVHSGTSPDDVEEKLSDFEDGSVYNVLVTSYEMFRRHDDLIKSASPDLLVCDEAHRLKNSARNQTINALVGLKCSKRILLTGRPIQNNLLELYAMIEFANPNLLGKLKDFKQDFAKPIGKSRFRDASVEEKSLGDKRCSQLQENMRFCILRRRTNVISQYLPKKTELQPLQIRIYEDFLKSEGPFLSAFAALATLRKLCNHPKLTDYGLKKMGNQLALGSLLQSPDLVGSGGREDWKLSGKLHCLHTILSVLHDKSESDARNKIVVASNFTSTLNIVQSLCQERGWGTLRLDGTTMVSKRQALVDRFNANCCETIFLLSAKAGGAGLNLIGANRLVLFDPDWNPATDEQAMARIWRDGQSKDVFIYRLLTTGSIEEKIYQRQIRKVELVAAVEGPQGQSSIKRHFCREDLRNVFCLNTETSCETHDLLSQADPSIAECWNDCSNEVEENALKQAIQTQVVTYVHQTVI